MDQQKSKHTARAVIVQLAAAAMLAFGSLVGFGPSAEAQVSPGSFRVDDCYRDLNYNGRRRIGELDALNPSVPEHLQYLREVVSICGAARPREGISFADYGAALAHRILGEAGSSSAGASHLDEASRLFELVRLRREPVMPSVELELARVDRLRGNFAGAGARLNDLAGRPGISSRGIEFERAMVVLDQDRIAQTRQLSEMTPARLNALQSAFRSLTQFANSPDASSDLYSRYRGPAALAALSLQLADRAQALPMTQDIEALHQNTRDARLYYTGVLRANTVLREIGGSPVGDESRIFANLGMLDLRLAGLLGVNNTPNFDCRAGGDPASLDDAGASFSQAVSLNPTIQEAHWGLGCVLMARAYNERSNFVNTQGGFESAIASFRLAVAGSGGGDRNSFIYYLSLARALVEIGQWEDRGETGALSNFRLALNYGGERATRIHIDMARIFVDKNQTVNALCSLAQAVGAPVSGVYMLTAAQDANAYSACEGSPAQLAAYAATAPGATHVRYDPAPIGSGSRSLEQSEAYLLRGQLLLDVLQDYHNARLNLEAASGEGPYQTQAFSDRSRLETQVELRARKRDFDIRRNAQPARRAASDDPHVSNADAAVAVSRATTAWDRAPTSDHRRQACIARIVFDQTRDGGLHCAADDSGENFSEGQLYLGMFYLREASRKRGVEQQNDWSRAELAFSRGFSSLGGSMPALRLNGQIYNVRDLLAYGRRSALFCGGLGGADTSEPPVAAVEFFAIHGIGSC
jgi:hypothetical protein